MERLTAEDRLMLWPDKVWPQDIGALAILDGGNLLDTDGRLRIEDLRRAIEARLHLVPRFRQVLHVPPPGLGGPLWTDAHTFHITDHVRESPLPAPGDETALLRATEQLRRRRLDRSRPLWEMWFLTAMPRQRIGLFLRMHHAIADGIAGVATIGSFLDTTPDTPAGSAHPWTPAPRPPTRALLADNLRRHADAVGRALSTLTRPATTARQIRAAWPALRDLFTAQPTPPTSLDRPVGPHRTLALIRSDLDLVKQIAHQHNAKINDVLLTLTAAGLRALLHSRGEPVEDRTMPVYVPITLRPAQHREQARGNLIGQMVVPLLIGEPDPAARLRRIAAETAKRKTAAHPNLGTMFRSRPARIALLKYLQHHPVSVTTADVPGPPEPIYLAGAPVLEVFPLLPLIAKVPLGIGALSYAGQLNIAAIADPDAIPDLDIFTTAARNELHALTATTPATAKPQPRSARSAVPPGRA